MYFRFWILFPRYCLGENHQGFSSQAQIISENDALIFLGIGVGLPLER